MPSDQDLSIDETLALRPPERPDLSDFSRALDPVLFARQVLNFPADAQQSALLRSAHPRTIINCTRQWGKSTTTAALAAHHLAFAPPGALSIVVSPSARQSAELVRKVEHFLKTAGFKAAGDGDNRCSICLPGGSRLVGLPSRDDTIRGFSAVSLLIIDEASRVPDSIYHAVLPMITISRGRLVLLSTPSGKRGFFYREWSQGGDRWLRICVPATECSRFTPEALEEQRLAHGDRLFRQEYLCEFLETDDQTFAYELVLDAITDDVEPLP